VDTGAVADQIREMRARDFADPQDVHDSLSGLHELVRALQEVLHDYGERFDETGVHPRYGEATREAAAGMNGIADQLEGVTSGGVMRGPGG
jgi:hypothetical protein